MGLFTTTRAKVSLLRQCLGADEADALSFCQELVVTLSSSLPTSVLSGAAVDTVTSPVKSPSEHVRLRGGFGAAGCKGPAPASRIHTRLHLPKERSAASLPETLKGQDPISGLAHLSGSLVPEANSGWNLTVVSRLPI